jgi:DNA-binding MarR family transcriptional regulator
MNLGHPSTCLTQALMRAARSLARGFEAEAAALGVSAAQFSTLARFGLMGDMTVSQIAASLATDRTTMTRNLAVMAGKGWIVETETHDRRERQWGLTDPGRRVLQEVMPLWQAWQARLVARLGAESASELMASLKVLETP